MADFVVLEGPRGSGKTTLLDTLATQWAQAQDCDVVWLSMTEPQAYKFLRQCVENGTGAVVDDVYWGVVCERLLRPFIGVVPLFFVMQEERSLSPDDLAKCTARFTTRGAVLGQFHQVSPDD